MIVKLNGDPERTLVIPLTATSEDGALAGDDYVLPNPASVTFLSGEVMKVFEFMVVHDDVDDDHESITIGFGALPDPKVYTSIQVETTVNITDDDDPAVKVSFSHADAHGSRGCIGGSLTVSVDVDPERSLTIPLSPTYDGGATVDDHSVVPDTVTLSTATRSVTIAFMAIEVDSEDDDEDQVIIGFGAMPDARVSAGDVPSTEISITDDDDPQVMVMFGAGDLHLRSRGLASARGGP